ncbi:hypothetical protein Pelo_16379 [Pelomyxa schiedti]|nr:hypothetical protein Pelo_16379 [Pelomyxa schiedti]
MTRRRGTAVCGVVDVSRMRVRLGSIPPVLFTHSRCMHMGVLALGPSVTFSSSATGMLFLLFLIHDSLSPWSPLLTPLRGIACAALLRFSSSDLFFLFPHSTCVEMGLLFPAPCGAGVATCQLLMKACHHQGKCVDYLCPFLHFQHFVTSLAQDII